MTVQMTERDKKLLHFVSAAAVVFLVVYYVLIPVGRKNAGLKAAIEEMQESMAQADMKTEGLPELRRTLRDNTERLDELAAGFYPLMESYQIDRLITTAVLERGLFIKSLSINLPEDHSATVPYMYSELADGRENTGTLPGFYLASLACELEGSCDRLWEFLDFLGEQEAICVKGVAWSGEEAEPGRGSDAGADSAYAMRLEFDLCMYGGYTAAGE